MPKRNGNTNNSSRKNRRIDRSRRKREQTPPNDDYFDDDYDYEYDPEDSFIADDDDTREIISVSDIRRLFTGRVDVYNPDKEKLSKEQTTRLTIIKDLIKKKEVTLSQILDSKLSDAALTRILETYIIYKRLPYPSEAAITYRDGLMIKMTQQRYIQRLEDLETRSDPDTLYKRVARSKLPDTIKSRLKSEIDALDDSSRSAEEYQKNLRWVNLSLKLPCTEVTLPVNKSSTID